MSSLDSKSSIPPPLSLQDDGAVVEDEEEEEEDQIGPHPDVETTVIFTNRPGKGLYCSV